MGDVDLLLLLHFGGVGGAVRLVGDGLGYFECFEEVVYFGLVGRLLLGEDLALGALVYL